MKFLFALSLLFIAIVSIANAQTAISGAGNYYIALESGTRGVQLTNPETYDALGDDFTIELWVRKTCDDGQHHAILSKHSQDPLQPMNNADSNAEFALQITDTNTINFIVGCGNGLGYNIGDDIQASQSLQAPYKLITNRWTHIAVVVNFKGDTLGINTGVATLYVDGVLTNSAIWAESSPVCSGKNRVRALGQPIRLGYYDNQEPGERTFCGDVDELRIWNVARTPQEIRSHYQGGVRCNAKGLVSLHDFHEGTGSLASDNLVTSSGTPRVVFNAPFPVAYEFFRVSDLKVVSQAVMTCQGYTASASFAGIDPTGANFNYFVTKIVSNTDSVFMLKDKRFPNRAPITLSNSDFPLNVGTDNLLVYVPGKVAGVDMVYYEARNDDAIPETTGPAKLFFVNRCCNSKEDSCRVCGGDGSDCKVSCDGKGGVRDACGVCNGNGDSCKGCDGIEFSPKRFDACGICGGPGTSCFDACNGVIDKCGVCNGNNECCVSYKGVTTDRLNWVLFNYTSTEVVHKLSSIDVLLSKVHDFVNEHNKRHRMDEFDLTGVVLPSRLPFELSGQIVAVNGMSEKLQQINNVLDGIVSKLSTQLRRPLREGPFLHVTH